MGFYEACSPFGAGRPHRREGHEGAIAVGGQEFDRYYNGVVTFES